MYISFKNPKVGDKGSDGKDAYQLAVQNGFKGTEEEWVASLNGETVKLQEKNYTITKNGTTTIAPDQDFDGIYTGTIDVNVPYKPIDVTGTGWETEPVFPVALNRAATLNDDIEYTKQKFAEWNPSRTRAELAFEEDRRIIYAPNIDTKNVTTMRKMFMNCKNLVSVPLLNTSNVVDMSGMFWGCKNLVSVPRLDTSKVTNMSSMFYLTDIATVPFLNTSQVTNMSSAFEYCDIVSAPPMDTSNVLLMNSMFSNCSELTAVPLLDASKVKTTEDMFSNCNKLTDLCGFKDLKASLELERWGTSYPLTHQSLLNVINNLGQADPAYSKGQPILSLGSTNLAKLTAEEIAVGTAKGWQIIA